MTDEPSDRRASGAAAAVAGELRRWPDRLEGLVARRCRWLGRVVVLAETGSTQDAARRMGLLAGEAVTAGRQTEGRGRLGRRWDDGAGASIALTVVAPADPSPRYALAAAVAVADALRGLLPRAAGDRVGIHWPNDVVIGPGKVAGILVEQDDRLARIGIGLNVLDRPWPPGVRGASVASAGGPADRLAVLERLLVELDRGLAAPMAEVVAAWDAASGLRGRLVRYDGVDGGTIEGIAGGLDGLGRLRVVDPADGTVRLAGPSATGGPVEA